MSIDVSQRVIQVIRQTDAHPRPLWQLLIKNYILWGLCFVFFLLASVSAKMTIFMARQMDWDLAGQIPHLKFIFLLIWSSLPLFWMIFFVFFVGMTYTVFKQTPRAYRYRTSVIIGILLFLVWVVSFVLKSFISPDHFDQSLRKRFTSYPNLESRQVQIWSRPEMGLLGGTIERFVNLRTIKISDFQGNLWTVTLRPERKRRSDSLALGQKVKIYGILQKQGLFSAYDIRPWQSRNFRKQLRNNFERKAPPRPY